MKLDESVLRWRRAGGMTLVELMIALGISRIRAFGLLQFLHWTATWFWIQQRVDRGASQSRAGARFFSADLHNATKIDFTQPLPVIVTLTVPSRYSSYYRNTGDPSVTFNAAAGDPTHAAIQSQPQPLIYLGR